MPSPLIIKLEITDQYKDFILDQLAKHFKPELEELDRLRAIEQKVSSLPAGTPNLRGPSRDEHRMWGACKAMEWSLAAALSTQESARIGYEAQIADLNKVIEAQGKQLKVWHESYERTRKIMRCAYCCHDFAVGQEIADHVKQCERSPLVKRIVSLENQLRRKQASIATQDAWLQDVLALFPADADCTTPEADELVHLVRELQEWAAFQFHDLLEADAADQKVIFELRNQIVERNRRHMEDEKRIKELITEVGNLESEIRANLDAIPDRFKVVCVKEGDEASLAVSLANVLRYVAAIDAAKAGEPPMPDEGIQDYKALANKRGEWGRYGWDTVAALRMEKEEALDLARAHRQCRQNAEHQLQDLINKGMMTADEVKSQVVLPITHVWKSEDGTVIGRLYGIDPAKACGAFDPVKSYEAGVEVGKTCEFSRIYQMLNSQTTLHLERGTTHLYSEALRKALREGK